MKRWLYIVVLEHHATKVLMVRTARISAPDKSEAERLGYNRGLPKWRGIWTWKAERAVALKP